VEHIILDLDGFVHLRKVHSSEAIVLARELVEQRVF
jgi:hypothetical protein